MKMLPEFVEDVLEAGLDVDSEVDLGVLLTGGSRSEKVGDRRSKPNQINPDWPVAQNRALGLNWAALRPRYFRSGDKRESTSASDFGKRDRKNVVFPPKRGMPMRHDTLRRISTPRIFRSSFAIGQTMHRQVEPVHRSWGAKWQYFKGTQRFTQHLVWLRLTYCGKI
jgi:hypothetical protein